MFGPAARHRTANPKCENAPLKREGKKHPQKNFALARENYSPRPETNSFPSFTQRSTNTGDCRPEFTNIIPRRTKFPLGGRRRRRARVGIETSAPRVVFVRRSSHSARTPATSAFALLSLGPQPVRSRRRKPDISSASTIARERRDAEAIETGHVVFRLSLRASCACVASRAWQRRRLSTSRGPRTRGRRRRRRACAAARAAAARARRRRAASTRPWGGPHTVAVTRRRLVARS